MSDHPPVEPDQADIVMALEGGLATGEGAALKRIDTHMSHVFIGRDHVYKLKRSLRHPFADMASSEARRRACEAELAVNAALAPELYEAVVPVVRDPSGRVTVGGEGEAVDWVVRLRRLPDGALFSELAAAGALDAQLVAEAVDAVAAFHAGLPPRQDAGHAVDYQRIVDGLRETEAEGAARLGLKPGSEPLFSAIEHEITRLTPLIEARRREGFVRRGHGDLHLRNICVFEGRAMPFDALEFDPALATADVLYDVAFLLLDLRANGLASLANVAMNRYWDAAAQPEAGLALLPVFMALRAAVRMAVSVEAGDLEAAARYRDIGTELLRPTSPRVLAIGGLSGSGKSTVAAAVAPDLPGPCGARLLRSDVVRKQVAGVTATERLPAAAYSADSRASVYHALEDRTAEALLAGASVVVDATFQDPAFQARIAACAGVAPFLGIWLEAAPEARAARVRHRRDDASDATAAVALAQEAPDQLASKWRPVRADEGEVREIVDRVRKAGGFGLRTASAASN